MYKRLFYANLERTLSKVLFKDAIECQTPIHLSIEQGEIPSWLNGIMYRIGPGRFNIRKNDGTEFVIRHAFDGLPFVHRFEINGVSQSLTYNSRMTAKSLENAIQNDTHKGNIYFGHFNRYDSFFAWVSQAISRLLKSVRFKLDHRMPDGNSIGVTTTPNFPLPTSAAVKEGRVLVSKTDANILQKIHADTLVPEMDFSYTMFDKRLDGELSAAHHQWDPETKEFFNFTLTIAPTPRLVVFCTSESGKVTVLGDITQRPDGTRFEAPYIHSFWLTKNYVVLPESPFHTSKPLNFVFTGNMLSALCWDDTKPLYFHVFHRDGRGLVATVPFAAFFTFHTANAFEKDGKLFLDCAAFENGDIMHQLQDFGQRCTDPSTQETDRTIDVNGIMHPVGPQKSYGALNRYCIDIKTQRVTKQSMATNVEFPRFNHEMALKDYQYVYGCRMYMNAKQETGSLVKVDLKDGHVKEFLVNAHVCSEPIFAAKPGAKDEDDGVLLTLANSTECCYLLVVDAREMKELARIKIGQFTAVTFHGSFVDHEFKMISPN